MISVHEGLINVFDALVNVYEVLENVYEDVKNSLYTIVRQKTRYQCSINRHIYYWH